MYFSPFCLFRAALTAFGNSQARGRIGVTAACLHHSHSNPDPSHICDPHHSSWQRWILSPLSKVWDRSCILLDSSWVRYHWATVGTPSFILLCTHACFCAQVILLRNRWLARTFWIEGGIHSKMLVQKGVFLENSLIFLFQALHQATGQSASLVCPLGSF